MNKEVNEQINQRIHDVKAGNKTSEAWLKLMNFNECYLYIQKLENEEVFRKLKQVIQGLPFNKR